MKNNPITIIYATVAIALLATGLWFSWRIYTVTTNQPQPLPTVSEYATDNYDDPEAIDTALKQVTGQASDQYVTTGQDSDGSFTAIDTYRLNQVVVTVTSQDDKVQAVAVSCPTSDKLLSGYDCRRPGALAG